MKKNIHNILVALLLIVFATPSSAQWTDKNNGLDGAKIRSAAVSTDGNTLFAGDVSQGVFKSTNNGVSWTLSNTGLTETTIEAMAVSGTTVFASTNNNGGIFRSLNNGLSWQQSGLSGNFISFLDVLGTSIYAGNWSDLYVSNDNGSTWNSVSFGIPTETGKLTVAKNSSYLFAGTTGGVYRSGNNGASWTQKLGIAPNNMSQFTWVTALVYYDDPNPTPTDESALFAATDRSGIYKSTDNGDSWTRVFNSTIERTNDIEMIGTTIFAATDFGVLVSTDLGANWSYRNNGMLNTYVHSIDAIGSNLIIGTEGAGVYISTDNGLNWSVQSTGMNRAEVNMFAKSGTDIFAGTNGAGLFKTTDEGETWTSANAGLTDPTPSAFLATGSNLLLGATDGVYASSSTGTPSWSITGLSSFDVTSLIMKGSNVFAGTTTGVFASNDVVNGYDTWNGTGLGNSVKCLAANSTNLFAGTASGVFTSIDDGANWTAVNTGLTGSNIVYLATHGSKVFASVEFQGVFVSNDNGTSWTNANFPNSEYANFLYSDGTDIFATSTGDAYVSSDDGVTWNVANNNEYIVTQWLAIIPTSTNILAGTNFKGVLARTKSDFYPPSIASFSPTSALQGTIVTITGANFTGTTAVSFGGTPAPNFTVDSPNTISAVVEAGSSGDVVVTTSGGTATLAGFTFLPPTTISAFSPTSASTGTTVFIIGSKFTGATDVSFGGTPAASFTIDDDQTISAVVGTGASGSVSVTSPNGTATLAGFTYIVVPTVTSFTPTNGIEGESVIITGADFDTTPSNNIVKFNGTVATVISSTSTEITTTVPSGATSGTISVEVNGQTGTSSTDFIVNAPTITSFTPTNAATNTTVTIEGNYFTNATTVSFGGTAAASYTVDSPTTISAVVGNGSSGEVAVTTPSGTGTLVGFTFDPPPSITSFSPTSGLEGTTITITGTDFDATPSNNIVQFNGTVATVTSSTTTQITTTVPVGATTGPISVEVNDQTGTSSSSFVVTTATSPTITSFNPTSGTVGETITLTGTNFDTTPSSNIVRFNGTTAVVSSSTSTQITTTVPVGATTGTITVEVNGETGISGSNFTVISTTPTITIFNPTSGMIGETVTITGTNFDTTPENNIVRFNGIVANVNNSTSTEIITMVPNGATTGLISVEVNGETAYSSSNFDVTSPVITSFSPLSGMIGETITIFGANFDLTPSNNIVRFNGVISTVTNSSSTQIVTSVPSGATTGPITVEVNGETANSSSSFIVTTATSPVITSFNPASGTVGESVTLTGTNFDTTPTNNIVKFNGTSATINSSTSTQITTVVPEGATTGSITIEVNGEIGISGSNFTVLNPVPTITSFSPTSGEIGTDVTIEGTNFSNDIYLFGNSVAFNGTLATITEVTASSIVATVPFDVLSGKITVSLNGNVATSAEDFIVIPSITAEDFPTSFDDGGALQAAIGLHTAATASSVQFHSKGITEGESAWTTSTIAPVENLFSATIPSSSITDKIGMEFYFTIEYAGGIITSSQGTAYIKYPLTGTAQAVPSLSFGNQLSNYQIVSIPLVLEDNKVTSVFNQLGTYDKTLWRLFDFNNGANREYSAFSTVAPGKGYWLIIRNPVSTLNPGEGTAVRVSNDSPFSISLASGWNLIGNPYNFDISWTEVKTKNPNADIGNLQIFSNGTLSENNTLAKYRGGFVFNNGGATSIEIPLSSKSGGRIGVEEIPSELSNEYWELSLNLSQGVLNNQVGGIGMHPSATIKGKDHFDKVAVPMLSGMGFFELGFDHPEFNARFNKEIVPTSEAYTWEVNILRDENNGPITLHWNNEKFGDNDYQLYLFNPVNLQTVDMRQDQSYQIGANVNQLKVIYGKQNYINSQLGSEMHILGEPYPNPTSGTVAIPFTVPNTTNNSTEVVYTIYDNTGKLVTREGKTFTTGVHEIKWQFERAGLYIIQLQLDNKITSKKIIVK